MIFRPALLSDAAQIAAFQIAMARETENIALDPPTVDKGVRAVFEQPARGQYFVTDDGGRAVGSLLITTEWSDWRNGTIWWIQSVYVELAYRGKGAFRGLYDFVRKQAEADPSVMGIRLYVEKHNTKAREIYARLGMKSDRYDVMEWMKTF